MTFPSKQIDSMFKKLNMTDTHSIRPFLDDFVKQLCKYMSANGVEKLINQISDQEYVQTYRDIFDKVVQNRKETIKFNLSFKATDLKTHCKLSGDNILKASVLLELVVRDLIVEQFDNFEEAFYHEDSPFYDLFNATLSSSPKSPQKTVSRKSASRKSSVRKSRRSSRSRKSTSRKSASRKSSTRKSRRSSRKSRKLSRK